MNKIISRNNRLGRRPQPSLQSHSTLRPYGTIETKKRSFSILLSFLLTWTVLTASARAGQVVTDEVRLWAKEAIAQEKAFETISAPNTVAVLYFHNRTGWSDLDLLQKGLTLMLITDLSKIKEIQLVERVKVQALAEELGLGVSGLVGSDTAPRVGKLLGVAHVIGGDILRGMIDDFQLKSNMLNVPVGEIYGQVSTQGKLLAELFRMEKDLLFEIIDRLKIELTPELESELKKPITTRIDAFRRLLQGLEDSDRGNYERAAASYQDSLKEDPNFTLAEDFLQELQGLQLWAGPIEDDSKAEAYAEPADVTLEVTPRERAEDRDLTEREAIHAVTDVKFTWTFNIDSDHPALVDELRSVSEAQANVATNPERQASVNKGEFRPGVLNQVTPSAENQWWEYEWTEGAYEPELQTQLQTLGIDESGNPTVLLNPDTLAKINSDPLLAYAVQVEEDRLNRTILEMHQDAHEQELIDTLMDNINTALGYAEIRIRDDWVTQQADAQAGRVLKDRNGHWVRVQQYILRPNNKTVQVLDVSLRGTGPGAGLTTFEWTTTFTENYTGNLTGLPWPKWMDTREEIGYRGEDESPYIRRYVLVDTNSSVDLHNMYVKFTNPTNDSLKEQRWFGDRGIIQSTETAGQYINDERLTINGSSEYVYYTGLDPNLPEGYYQVVQTARTDGNPAGFKYTYASQSENGLIERDINVAFFIVGDATRADNVGVRAGEASFDDIWDALRVNTGEGAPYIGNNNLEIAIDDEMNVFTMPIDVVYIPMSRMLWKVKGE